MVSWSSITLGQYQGVYKIMKSDMEELDKQLNITALLLNKTPYEIENLSVSDFNKTAKELAFVFTEKIPVIQAKKIIKTAKNRYAINYDVSKYSVRQYVETKHFLTSDFIDNIHLILASNVEKVKYKVFKSKNSGEDHRKVAEDLLNAKFIDVYHSTLFFCQLLKASINGIADYLEKMTSMRLKNERILVSTLLRKSMDGFIP